MPTAQRNEAMDLAEHLVQEEEYDETRAVFEAVRALLRPVRRDVPSAVTNSDVSLGRPHGPEGESHGGRAASDPLRSVEDERFPSEETAERVLARLRPPKE